MGELEVRQRMRWAVGYTLRPGNRTSTARPHLNRTPVANTMLCFANVAVHANDNIRSFSRPTRSSSPITASANSPTWPIATGRYAGADFGNGTDVSWYSNHINANSMFAWNYTADFFGGYDHGKQAGTLSVADHHIIPGKKFWTWGNGPRGRMWDKILTDTDGPYIELMTGAYSDNQPDYSWLQPFRDQVVRDVLVSVPRHRRGEKRQPRRRGEPGSRDEWRREGGVLHDGGASRGAGSVASRRQSPVPARQGPH